MDIKIAEAVPEDARAISEVQYKTWLETYPNKEAGITVDDIHDRFKNRFTDESIKKREEYMRSQPANQKTWVVRMDGRVVGFGAVIKHEDKNQLQSIYLLPEMQGRGVGRKLWEEMSKFSDPSKDTIVQVATYNAPAVGFYKKLGFVDTGKRFSDERFRMKSGAVIPEMEMIIKAK